MALDSDTRLRLLLVHRGRLVGYITSVVRDAHLAEDVFQSVAAARTAFDLERESPGLRHRYGNNAWGQGLLLCRRLVEAGVTFVTLNTDSYGAQWDSHANLKASFEQMLPVYDEMLTALIEDLTERGLY